MTGQHPDSPYAKALFAESLVEQSRYKEAADLYKSILASDNQPPCMKSEAGLLFLKQGDTRDADIQFKAERSQHPECSMALLGEARLNIDEGNLPVALQLVQQTWDHNPAFLTANAPLLFDGLPSARAQDFLNDLAQTQSDQSLYAALTQPPQTTRHDAHCASPANRNQATLETLAACGFFAGDYELTYDTAHALQSLPSHPQAQALYWAIKANEKLALESLARFQQLAPNSAQSHLLLGDIYRQRERYDDAQKEYAKALDLSPNDTAALLGLASAYYGDQNIGMTLETAQKALAQSPNDPDINLLVGEALLSQHKFADAESYLLKALNAKPQILPHVHALLGEAYAADNKPQDAIRELKLGASSDQDGSVHYHLARLYSKLGDTADAAAAIQQMKALQQKRREGAVIAIEDAHPSTLDDTQ
jgi:tetratricopeptide (TPR) repeat protein